MMIESISRATDDERDWYWMMGPREIEINIFLTQSHGQSKESIMMKALCQHLAPASVMIILEMAGASLINIGPINQFLS